MVYDRCLQHPLISREDLFRKTNVNVLVIEDNPLIQLVHKEILVELGCQVDMVSSGEEALSMINNTYEVILLDIELPGISGIEVAIKFRRYNKHKKTRMIALTSHSDMATKNLCFRSGIERVLNKPVSIKDLWTLIYPL